MTIGEKIILLRGEKGISQEQLAEELFVSRQSVSKWEMDQSLPQIEKIIHLCDLFSVTADELLREDITLSRGLKINSSKSEIKNKYFGTDGFRGEANITLTSMHAYRVGRFLGWYYSVCGRKARFNGRTKIVIGKDTRRSSYMLEYAIVAGITASGADAYMLHVTTTPSVSYVTRQDEFDCGVMITASHNPFYDNGIKILNNYGEKLDDETASLVEAYIDGDLEKIGVEGEDIPFATGDKLGCIVDYVAGRNRYVGYLISLAANSYKNLRIGIDCANGASWMIAKSVFDALGAQIYLTGAQPDGLNINLNCGSTHIENLCKLVRENHLDVGFAFDGDADRCIAVDEKGTPIDGDGILYILASRLKSRGMLDKNTVVSTVMSNSGLVNALAKIGIKCERTNVGDRFIYECMQKNGYRLGGEQSGHIIIQKYATTGDGILTAIMLAEQMCDEKSTLSALVKGVEVYPQFEISVKVKDKDAVTTDTDILNAVENISEIIGENGRILLRKSGTEPVVRIMTECQSYENCKKYANDIYELIKKKGYANE